MVKRVLILVIDAMGIGEMPDVVQSRPQDRGAHTLLHIAQAIGGLRLPAFQRLGLGILTTVPGLQPVASHLAAIGRNHLAHFGADTYMGHQELLGSRPFRPKAEFMAQVGPQVAAALRAQGHGVEPLVPAESALLVDGLAVVADNLEGEVGGNINVTGSLEQTTFDNLVAVGEAVRTVVQVGRVIVCASKGWRLADLHDHLRKTDAGQFGVDTPGLGVYNDTYCCRHLGLGVSPQFQVTSLVAAMGVPVTLIGKVADIIDCPGARYLPAVDTGQVLRTLQEVWQENLAGLLVVNVQESDLAGHGQDPIRWGQILRQVDDWLAEFLPTMAAGDLMIVTGDHGNDPCIGHSQHTREMTPLLVYGPAVHPVDLGDRATLADIAATAAEVLGAPRPEYGDSFASELFRG